LIRTAEHGPVELLGDLPAAGMRAAVLVEGTSDVLAVRAVAERRGLDLDGLRVALVPMGGATNARRHVELLGPSGLGVRLAGLYDAAQEPVLRRAVAGLGAPSGPGLSGLEALGFFGCTPDLEHELIRALGIAGVTQVIAAEGELASLRLLQRQPAQRNRTTADQLHRFLGARSGRKARYAWLLARALEPDQVPRPLARLVDHVLTIPDGR
jgi:hypothetical protein